MVAVISGISCLPAALVFTWCGIPWWISGIGCWAVCYAATRVVQHGR